LHLDHSDKTNPHQRRLYGCRATLRGTHACLDLASALSSRSGEKTTKPRTDSVNDPFGPRTRPGRFIWQGSHDLDDGAAKNALAIELMNLKGHRRKLHFDPQTGLFELAKMLPEG
jgi:hypothetical protein